MSKILKLDLKYDLWLSYSWSNNDHGVCGHLFEVIDYYLFLKDYFKVGIFLAENITWNNFLIAVKSKYDITLSEIEEMQKNTVFSYKPKLVSGKNILFTDGGARQLKNKTLIFDNIFYFACGDFTLQNNNLKYQYILQDERFYSPCPNSFNYKKKINFKRYKTIQKSKDSILLYLTKNCRNISRADYEELLILYKEKFLCLTNHENRAPIIHERLKAVSMPVENFFEQFSTYIYTPVSRKFDCSPRLIAECKFYSKKVIYHKIDYLKEDRGLYWRKWDIDNSFESLFLKEGDGIISILGRYL